ncbi:MAG: NADPH-dependent FMN reductase [Flavobacteriales bacterium]|nr:NADPH-dependent FMN reductase [Flavobacteriales bacterium]
MITIIAGTNRKNSVTLKVARYYEKLLNQRGESCQVLDLATLPRDFVFSSLYGEENLDFSQITEQFIFAPSKLVVVTPEYNGSFPGIMKSFIDGWNPRKVSDKWVALVGVSSGRQGNARGMDDLTNILNYLKINVIPVKSPLSQIFNLLNDNGDISDDGMNDLISLQLDLLIEK